MSDAKILWVTLKTQEKRMDRKYIPLWQHFLLAVTFTSQLLREMLSSLAPDLFNKLAMGTSANGCQIGGHKCLKQ
ncbi:hypothetical protein DPEC_G00278510, partial [Dallia pectoralis]